MPLVKCADCAQEISPKAEKCPKCGAPNKAYAKLKGQQQLKQTAGGCGCLLLLALGIWTLLPSIEDQEATAAKERERFVAHLAQHEEEARALFAQGEVDASVDLLRRFEEYGQSGFGGVPQLWAEARSVQIRAEFALPGTRSATYEYELLSELFALNPKDEALSEELAAAEHDHLIAVQFDVWNGSHMGLVRLVKDSMNDPGSFEHVETRYVDEGETIRVQMRYRGRNAFGGLVAEHVVARYRMDGTLVEVLEQG